VGQFSVAVDTVDTSEVPIDRPPMASSRAGADHGQAPHNRVRQLIRRTCGLDPRPVSYEFIDFGHSVNALWGHNYKRVRAFCTQKRI